MVLPGGVDKDRSQDLYDIWSIKIRDTILYIVGIAGIVNELWIVDEPRIAVLIFVGSLVGVPVVLRADERRSGKNGNGDS